MDCSFDIKRHEKFNVRIVFLRTVRVRIKYILLLFYRTVIKFEQNTVGKLSSADDFAPVVLGCEFEQNRHEFISKKTKGR